MSHPQHSVAVSLSRISGDRSWWKVVYIYSSS